VAVRKGGGHPFFKVMKPNFCTLLKSASVAMCGVMALAAAADVDSLNQQARAALKQSRAADSIMFLGHAEDVVRKALRLAPDDFEARKLEIKVLLAGHRFREALERARTLNHGTPDDVEAWGLVSDAALGLGDYAEAERTAQWMLNLRSTNVGGLERGARLRELFGDTDGAREFWEASMRLTLSDDEERAWIATQMAALGRRTGRIDQAEKLINQVLGNLPGYQPALAELARVRMEQHKYTEAATVLEERFRQVPRPDVQFELAHALQMAGREADALAAYAAFEKAARAAMDVPYNYNHELVAYYTDRAPNAAEALRVAKTEASRRQDVDTLDAYAWALCAAGDLAEAQKQIDKALAVGLRDSALFYHAGAIASRHKDAAAATRYFTQALSISPQSEAAHAALLALKEINPRAD
jgi:tetratricopeptide (TPR) repeat protein